MKKKNLSAIARKRLGRTKRERSLKMSRIALLKHKKLSAEEESKHGKMMRKARFKKIHLLKITP